MFFNYLKITLASLWRRKWFSLLTLLSIALSLVVVTCAASLWNMLTAPIAPEIHKDRTFFLYAKVHEKKNGKEVLYTHAGSVLHNDFFYKDIYRLHTPKLATAFNAGGTVEFICKNKTRRFDLIKTDHNFFKVFQFDFVGGKSYAECNNQASIPHCVITEGLAKYYFGKNDCLGKIISCRSGRYEVCGVVKKPASSELLQADLYFQFNPRRESRYANWCDVVFLCDSSKDKEALDVELSHLARLVSDNNKRMEVKLLTVGSAGLYLKRFFYFGHRSYSISVIMILVVLIIPSLCLVDILKNNQENRNYELGVRRAFGASRQRMIGLLLVENVAVTLMGGAPWLVVVFLLFCCPSRRGME